MRDDGANGRLRATDCDWWKGQEMTTPLVNADATATANVGGPTATASVDTQAHGVAASIDPAVLAAIKQEARDSAFAEARRQGLFKDSKKTAPSAEAAASVPAVDLRALDRALMRTGLGASLSDAAIQRMERAFQAESPSDAGDWVKEYLGSFGVAPTATQTVSAPAAAPKNATPASDGGAPPAARVVPDEPDLLSASVADREHYAKVLGPRKFVALYRKQMAGIKISLR